MSLVESSLLLRRFVFGMAEASAKRVTVSFPPSFARTSRETSGYEAGWWGWGAGRTWGGDLIVFVGPRVGYLTDLVPPGEGIS